MISEGLQKVFSIVLFISFTAYAFFQFVTGDSPFGQVYTVGAILSLIFIAFSYIIPKYFDYSPVNSDQPFARKVGVGLLVGVILLSSVLFSFSTFFSPLSIPQIAGLLAVVGALGTVILASIFPSEFEETILGVLRASMKKWFESHIGFFTLTSMILGLFLYSVEPLRFISIIIFGIGVLNFLRDVVYLESFFKNEYVQYGFAIIYGALFFSLLHLKAYGNPLDVAATTGLILNAFLYASMTGVINSYFKDTISSRVAHTTNNAYLAAVVVGQPIFAIVPIIAHIFLLWVSQEGDLDRLSIRRLFG